MKTTLEMPDSLFRWAKETALKRGQTMTLFFNAAVEAKLNAEETAGRNKPWMAFSDDPPLANVILCKSDGRGRWISLKP